MSEYIFLPKGTKSHTSKIDTFYEPPKTFQGKSPVNPVMSSGAKTLCCGCLREADSQTIINQFTFTLPAGNGYRFESRYLCMNCQEIYFQHLQSLLGKKEKNETPTTPGLPKIQTSEIVLEKSEPSVSEEKILCVDDIFAAIRVERARLNEGKNMIQLEDKEFIRGELARAAASYILPAKNRGNQVGDYPAMFPWVKEEWHPSPENRQKELIKGLALGVAELERLNELYGKSEQENVVHPSTEWKDDSDLQEIVQSQENVINLMVTLMQELFFPISDTPNTEKLNSLKKEITVCLNELSCHRKKNLENSVRGEYDDTI